MEDPKTRREKKGGKKDKGPYSAKHVRLVATVTSGAVPAVPAKKK